MYQVARFQSVKMANVWLLDKQQESAKENKQIEITQMSVTNDSSSELGEYTITFLFREIDQVL